MSAPSNFLRLTSLSTLNLHDNPSALKDTTALSFAPADHKLEPEHARPPLSTRKARMSPRKTSRKSPRKISKAIHSCKKPRPVRTNAEDTRTTKLPAEEKLSTKRIAPVRKLEPVQHPLFVDYKEAFANWTTEASKSLNHSLSVATDELTTTLTHAINNSNTLRSTHSDLVDACIKPLADQLLRIRLNANTRDEQALDVRMGDRMESFQKQTVEGYQQLRELWMEWEKVTNEIAGMVIGETGTDGDAAQADGAKSGKQGDVYAEGVMNLEEQYARETRDLLLKYEEDCAELQRKLEESDKAMEKSRRMQKETMWKMMQQQLKAIEELEDQA